MAEARPNVHKRRLGSALRSLRIAAGFQNMEDAAKRLGLSGKSALSKIENGKQRVSGLGLTAFFQVYGVNEEATKTKIRTLASFAASGKRTNLLDEYGDTVSDEFEEYLNLEGMAAKAEVYLHVIPGLLQTKAYATAIVESGQGWGSRREVNRFVELRLARQRALSREEPDPIQLWCILDESALRRQVGGPDTMRDQLRRLLEAEEGYSNVALQVLPFDRGANAGIDGPFQLLHFPSGPPVVVVDSMTTSLYLEEDKDIGRYETVFDHLRSQALDHEESRRFIHELIQD